MKFGYQHVDRNATRHAGATRRHLEVVLDDSGVHRAEYTLDRAALGLDEYDTIVPLITGFGFDTDIEQDPLYPRRYDPAHGYLTRGLGADVSLTELDDETLTLSVWLRYGFGAAMDRPHHNEALLYARIAAELDIAFVGLDGVAWQTGSVDYRLEYDDPKIGLQQSLAPATDDQKRIVLQGRPGAPLGCVGIQGFNFELSPVRSCRWNADWPLDDRLRGSGNEHPLYGPPGYYIRELTIDVSPHRYDPSTGRAEFMFDGFASNATRSVAFHPLCSHFRGRLAWLQLDGANPRVQFDSEFSTGRADFSLFDTP